MNHNNPPMTSWIEPTHYDSHLSVPYLHPLDRPESSMRGADHPASIYTGYSYTPRHSPNTTRPTYNSGLYGPRPQPPPVDPIQGLPTPAMPPSTMAMEEVEEVDDEYMEVESAAGIDEPIYQSEYADEAARSQGKRRFVGGFIRGLRKVPKVVKRRFLPEKREVLTPPGLAYNQPPYRPPYVYEPQPQDAEEAPPYDDAAERVDSDLRYTDAINMPAEFRSSDIPSRTPSHTIRAPRSESQLTYQSLTEPPARHVSQHGSLHHSQRSSLPRTVRNPDPPSSPTDESVTPHQNSPRRSQPLTEMGSDSASRTPRLSPYEPPIRRPTVTVQSPTGSPVYFEPQRSDDYAGMDMDSPVEPSSEQPSMQPSQFSRIAKFFRELNNLPWVAPNVTADFDPTDAEQARSAHTLTHGSGKSWYTGHLHDLDLLGGGGGIGSGGGSSTRGLTVPSGHGPAPGSSATLAPHHGSGSAASSSEGAASAAHLPSAPPAHPAYPYPVHTLALPPQPLYLYPYPAAMPPPPLPPHVAHASEKQPPVSPQLSGQSDVQRQPYLFMVAMPPPPAMPPGYMPVQQQQQQPAYFSPV